MGVVWLGASFTPTRPVWPTKKLPLRSDWMTRLPLSGWRVSWMCLSSLLLTTWPPTVSMPSSMTSFFSVMV